MSLIIAYIGKKGCVMASDKRRITYTGKNRELLEEELYNGSIRTNDEFLKRAEELDVDTKITEDGNKIRIVGNAVCGEVREKTPFEVKRRRVYGTTNGYQLVELIGSETKSRKAGESGIIIFGNIYAKQQAQTLISRYWKSSQSLKYMGEIFEKILSEVSRKTPTIGDKFDVLLQSPKFTKSEAQKHLNITIDNDIKVLTKFRNQLLENMVQQKLEIEMSNKILLKGEVGKVVSIDDNMLQIQLNDKTQAVDGNWRRIAAPNENVLMLTDSDDVEIGDKVIIENEVLCLEKNNSPLQCNIILCSL
ncbi:MAG: DUF2121 domain-containing protein [Methanobrevibacter sp.]|nr:DUF2121 domain-containing protein [Methanobrevibacter sp.]